MAYIVKPLVTEKVNDLTEKQGKYCFIVRPDANKAQIQDEVEARYKVKVLSVNTSNYAGKNKSRYTRTGILRGKTPAYKKAYITLKEGDTIDFFSNI